MRRALIALTVSALATVGLVGPVSAAPNPANVSPSITQSAFAIWETSPPAAFVHTLLGVSSTDGQAQLTLESATVDSATGHLVKTSADATEGFTFTMDTMKFSTASVAATNLPVSICTYDENLTELGCVDGTIDLSVTWAGTGRYQQTVFIDLVNSGEFIFHMRTIARGQNPALASGTIGDVTVATADVMQADFNQSVTTTIKHGH